MCERRFVAAHAGEPPPASVINGTLTVVGTNGNDNVTLELSNDQAQLLVAYLGGGAVTAISASPSGRN